MAASSAGSRRKRGLMLLKGFKGLDGSLWSRCLHPRLSEVMAAAALHVCAELGVFLLAHAAHPVKEVHPPRPETAASVAHPVVTPRWPAPGKEQLQQKAYKQQTRNKPQREKQKGHKVKTSPDQGADQQRPSDKREFHSFRLKAGLGYQVLPSDTVDAKPCHNTLRI